MTGPRAARWVAAIAVAALAGYVAVWLGVSRLDVGRSDFTSTYVGGTLLRSGERAQLYDEPAQAAIHRHLIAPDTEGNLPFVDAPVAAALAAPVTWLSLDAAYRLWSVLQLAVLALAVFLAGRAAPWPPGTPRAWRAAAVAGALAGGGTLVELMQAQWGSVAALGLALAYRDWRSGRQGRGAALLVLSAGVAKPHLAVGLLAFMAGWRSRRVIAGALAGGAAAFAANLAVAGPAGLWQFLHLAIASNTRWQLRTFSGFVGIPGSFLGNSGLAQVIGAVGSVIALGVAVQLGGMVRRRMAALEPALAGAAALSLLAAPHAGMHDLVMLAPAAAWMAAWALGRDRAATWVMALWLALSLAAFVSLADGAAVPPGQLVPWALIAIAAVAWWAARRVPAPARPVTSQGDAAPLGALADGLRGRERRAGRGMLPLLRRGT